MPHEKLRVNDFIEKARNQDHFLTIIQNDQRHTHRVLKSNDIVLHPYFYSKKSTKKTFSLTLID